MMEETVAQWSPQSIPWFRGQRVDMPLKPRLFRRRYSELDLIQLFRMRAPMLGPTPNRDHLDEWLFLMQHHGLPTRLLDWTDGALIALRFAITDIRPGDQPVVWMLSPQALNEVSTGDRHFSPTWGDSAKPYIDPIFTGVPGDRQFPAAFYPVHVHSRMAVQRSCFTIYGVRQEGLDELLAIQLVQKGLLTKYRISPEGAVGIRAELNALGVSYSTLFPDFDGLAKELTEDKG